MTITWKPEGEKLTVVPEGRLDTTTAPELEKELKAKLAGVKELVFDFSKLEYISSAGLRVLLSVQRSMSMGSSMKVTHMNEIVQEVFEVTGFCEIIKTE